MKKRILSLIIVAALALNLSGCGSDAEESKQSPQSAEDNSNDSLPTENAGNTEERYDDNRDENKQTGTVSKAKDDIYEDYDSDEEWEQFFESICEQIVVRGPHTPNDWNQVEIDDDLPDSYDLRDYGFVTPVKLQNPWSTCWAFGVSCAAETSILSGLGLSAEEFEQKYGFAIDLSEKHLAYFTNKALPEKSDKDYKNYNKQDGEGIHFLTPKLNQEMTTGYAYRAATSYAAGIGPVLEADYPYAPDAFDSRNEAAEAANDVLNLATLEWSLSEEDRFDRIFEIIDANLLPTPIIKSDDGTVQYVEAATQIIKSEIVNGRGVAISYKADTASPGQESEQTYINLEEAAQYVYNPEEYADHEVCIIGYDDNYPKENFLEGHQPPDDGAFICKNSWGCKDAENEYDRGDWGYNGTGYFYLSYYDTSLSTAMSFEFDTQLLEGTDYDVFIDGYDFLGPNSNYMNSLFYPEEVMMANVFNADSDLELSAVSVQTMGYNCETTFSVYALKDGYKNPVDGDELLTVTTNFRYPGYHRVELEEPLSIPDGQEYSIVEKVVDYTDDGEVYEIVMNYALNDEQFQSESVGVRMMAADDYDYLYDFEDYDDDNMYNESDYSDLDDILSGNSQQMYSKGVINRGESYLFFAGDWVDQLDFVMALKPAAEAECVDFDNFPIKGYVKVR